MIRRPMDCQANCKPCFADDRLNHQEREIVTIAALGSMNSVQAQFESHINIGKNTDLTDAQIDGIKAVIVRLK